MKRKKTFEGSPARVVIGLALSLAICLSPWWIKSERLPQLLRDAVLLSARLEFGLNPAQEIETNAAAGQMQQSETVEPETITTTSTTATTVASTTTTTVLKDGFKPVSEQRIGKSGIHGSGTNADVYVKNSTGYTIDIDKLISRRPDCYIKLNANYQVLIVHTHTTETYADSDSAYYDPARSPRTTDSSRNMIAVGNVVAAQLEAAGIRTLHITTVHDYPEYNGSYNRAAETIKAYLDKYPSIEMVIDIHRDAITRDDGTKIKPTAIINGKKAAQVMILTGCDAGGSLYFPNWENNMTMALRLQRQLNSDWEGLTRPVYFVPYRYNMHLTPNSLLLEFGTDVNTLEEALYSAELVGSSLAKLLLEYEC